MNLVIPHSQRDDVALLLHYPQESFRRLINVIDQASPQLDPDTFAKQLSSKSSIPIEQLSSLVELLVVWCAIGLDLQQSPSELVDELIAAAAKSKDERLAHGWAELRSELERALGLRTLCIIAKARDVGTLFFRNVFGARIISDARPVFSLNPSAQPEGFVLTHTLQVTAREEAGGQKDWYFSLDFQDLMSLKNTVERALKKHQTLKSFFNSTSARILE